MPALLPEPYSPTHHARSCAADCRVGISGRGARRRRPPALLFTRLRSGRLPRCLTGAASVRGDLRQSVERSTIAKLGYRCDIRQRAVFMGEEPRKSQGSHFCVQAPAQPDPEERPLPPSSAARAGMCCGERRRGNGGGGEEGRGGGRVKPRHGARARPHSAGPHGAAGTTNPGMPCARQGCSRGRPAPNKINKINKSLGFWFCFCFM